MQCKRVVLAGVYTGRGRLQDDCMSEAKLKLDGIGSGSVPRRRRSAMERRLIVEETLEAGSSVARVARAHGVNANQVFQWRRMYREGLLGGQSQSAMKLLPVTLSDDAELVQEVQAEAIAPRAGAIHIELPYRALISLEGCVDAATVRAVLESLRS
jgi:transposase